MAFYNEITQYNTLTTTHCDNFNEVNQKLLENTLQNHQDIGNLNLLSTTQKDSLVSAVNEVKQSIPSSTNINQTIDQKISTHNQLTTSHQDIRSQVNTLENQIQGINISANIETHNTNQTAHQDIRKEINVLSTDRGYKDTKIVPNNTDFNTITDNGIYWANAWVHKNIPTLADGTRLNGVVHVMQADSVVYQFFHSNKGKWYREKYSTGWTNWQQITTNNETIVKMGELTNSHNMNNVVKSGVYRIFGTTPANFVSGQTNGYFSVLVYENNLYVVQEATNFVTGQIYKRLINSNDGEIFKDWYEVATTAKTDILLESEWTNMDSSSMPFRAIKTGNIVTLSGIIKAGIVTNTQVIATLPTEYRPKKYLPFTCMKYRKNEQAAFAITASTGALIVYNRANELTITTGEDISFNFSYNID